MFSSCIAILVLAAAPADVNHSNLKSVPKSHYQIHSKDAAQTTVILRKSTTIRGIRFSVTKESPAAIDFFTKSGSVACFTMPDEGDVNGLLLPRGAAVSFWEKGSVASVVLPFGLDSWKLRGLPCQGIIYFFREKQRIETAQLSQDFEIDGYTYEKGSWLTFGDGGKVANVEKAKG